MIKICTRCDTPKTIDEFFLSGRGYRKSYCKECDNEARRRYHKEQMKISGPEMRAAGRTRYAARKDFLNDYYRRRRKDPKHRARFIVTDSRRTDKRLDRKNELTIPIVEALIVGGCHYCGDTAAVMTLDRIDNTIGHVVQNVIPACLRCNYIRRDMPHEAWMALVAAIRKAREAGLFGTWASGPRRNVIN